MKIMNSLHDNLLKLYQASFRQSCDATCGPASIILATASLGLEQKQESEWVSSGFARWMPVNQFLERGMALHELQFISELIYGKKLDIVARRSYPENFPQFLNDIRCSFEQNNSVIIVNYLQDDFVHTTPAATGNPHYSPVVDWDKINHKILIADVDPAILEPYWVNIADIYQSMTHCNPAFNIPRGWLVLHKREA